MGCFGNECESRSGLEDNKFFPGKIGLFLTRFVLLLRPQLRKTFAEKKDIHHEHKNNRIFANIKVISWSFCRSITIRVTHNDTDKTKAERKNRRSPN